MGCQAPDAYEGAQREADVTARMAAGEGAAARVSVVFL
jgi:hypothetical protein